MKTPLLHIGAATALTLAAVAPARAQDFTPQATLQQLFDVEGNNPYPTPYAGTLEFSALASKYNSGHGHGYRNEVKVADKLRKSAAATHEHFAAQVTPTLPDGAKTIVAQYHVEGLDTIVKVYVQDTADREGLDGKDGNGVFDILARVLGPDGKEATTALGTVRSGETFGLDVRFDGGTARVAVDNGGTVRRTPPVRIGIDERKIYFKFGDYLQALDPDTGKHTIVAAAWDRYYREHHIDQSSIRFAHVVFERDDAMH